jgi:hypothetical protein
VDRESSALPSVLTILWGMLFAGFAMQVFTAVTLIMCNSAEYRFVGKMLLVFAGFVLLFLWLYAYKAVRKGRDALQQDSDAYQRHLDEHLYHHPIDKRRLI